MILKWLKSKNEIVELTGICVHHTTLQLPISYFKMQLRRHKNKKTYNNIESWYLKLHEINLNIQICR